MRVLVTGGGGQLGRALARVGARGGHDVRALPRAALDVTDAAAVAAALDVHRPAVVINAAADTGVDRAEARPDRAFAVNAIGADRVARACAARAVPLLHVSTDHVFDGLATRPYGEDAAVRPRSVYGRSKAEGEAAVRAAGGVVVRTSWLFSADGRGFVPAIVRAARRGDPLRAVVDHTGSPTAADDLARVLLALGDRRDLPAVLHVAGEPAVTRLALAQAVVDALVAAGAIAPITVAPASAATWWAPAARPAYAALGGQRLRGLGLAPPPWRCALGRAVRTLARGR